VKRALALAGALLRFAFAESLAYRAELLLWVLATTMPLVMMALFSAVTEDAPLEGYDRPRIVTYFLATVLVRHATSSWAAWALAGDIRQGLLSLRLLRPVHPLLSYALESLTSIPLRLVAAAPLVAIFALSLETGALSRRPEAYALLAVVLVQAWLLSVTLNLVVGCASFFVESGVRLMEFVQVVFFLASGYLFPLDLLPGSLHAVADALPFRYQLALPVELLVGRYDGDLGVAVALTGRESLWVVALGAVLALAWNRGVRRFEAYGG
jgi:ABC-2 type transport system permease protein